MTDTINRRWVLASRPTGAPSADNFRLETLPIPQPGEGEMLLRTLELSLDPYMRGRMTDGAVYAEPTPLNDPMLGQTTTRVIASNLAGYAPGDLVLSRSGWQDYALSNGAGVRKIDPGAGPRSWALGLLGSPAFTAWYGLTQIGQPKPGETLVVAAATGPVGSMVVQIGKILGCRVVAIAGGADKCAFVTDTLGADACLDHRAGDFEAQLKAACPDGVDIYFENVGGRVLLAVLPLFNPRARVPVCGQAAMYNSALSPDADYLTAMMSSVLRKKMLVQGFVVAEHAALFPQFQEAMTGWVRDGRATMREDPVEGLENAPEGLMRLFAGQTFGKVLVRVAD